MVEEERTTAVGTLVSIWAVGTIVWLTATTFAIFFDFLWEKGAFSKTLALVFSMMSWLTGSTPQPYIWTFDNGTQSYVENYMVPPPGTATIPAGAASAGIFYYIIFISGIFLVLVAIIRLWLYFHEGPQAVMEEAG